MKILFCGSRTFTNMTLVRRIVNDLTDEFACLDEKFVCIEGAARGADTLARIACKAAGWTIESYPANWALYGKSAGYKRNAQMLKEGQPDLVVAFRSNGESRGTDMMIRISEEAGVPVRIFKE